MAKLSSPSSFGSGIRWPWVVAALVLLVLVTALFAWSSANRTAARQELAAAQQQLAAAQEEEVRTIELARRAQLAQKLLRDASAQDLSHKDWAERRFNVKQATMSRAAANALLSEMVRSRDRMFGAEEFELSVRQASEGLFSSVVDPTSTVQVSVRGSLLFRTTGVGS
jgi:reverse gyrase